MTPTPTPRPALDGATAADTGAPVPGGWLSAHPVPLPVFAARIGFGQAASLVDALRRLGVLNPGGDADDPRPSREYAAWFDAGLVEPPDGCPGTRLLLNPAGQVAVLIALNAGGYRLPACRGERREGLDQAAVGERR